MANVPRPTAQGFVPTRLGVVNGNRLARTPAAANPSAAYMLPLSAPVARPVAGDATWDGPIVDVPLTRDALVGDATWDGAPASVATLVMVVVGDATWDGTPASVLAPTSVVGRVGDATWDGASSSSTTNDVSVTAALFETLTGLTSGPSVASMVLETMTGLTSGPSVTSALIETLVAEDITSTHITGVVIETLVAQTNGACDISAVVIETLVGGLRPVEDRPVARYTDIAERRFGRDLVLPLPGLTVEPTATGDWPTIAGRPNLHAAMRRRLITTPTQVVHRPLYGGGLELVVGTPSTPAERALLAARARQNALRDERVDEVQVLVSEDAGRTIVQMNVRPAGEVETETVSVVSEA